ncbi:MAG: anion:sodium symporter, partial [Rectinemataceae bacterium]
MAAGAHAAGKKRISTRKGIITLILAAMIGIVLMQLPLPDHLRMVRGSMLDQNGQKALGVLAFALVLWISEALPFHVTGMLSILALALVGAGDFQTVIRKGFGDDVV